MSSNIQIQRACQLCSKEFTARTTVTKYCSDSCAKKAYKLRDRELKILKSNEETKQIRLKPFKDIDSKPFLNISETCQLLGVSRRTLYRMLNRGELFAGKAGKRTILRRSDLDLLFNQPQVIQASPLSQLLKIDIKDCYSVKDVMTKYKISEKTLYEVVKRNNIQRVKDGIYIFFPKTSIDGILG